MKDKKRRRKRELAPPGWDRVMAGLRAGRKRARRMVILDLANGDLVSLEGRRVDRLDVRQAPDGTYRVAGGELVVRDGAVGGVNGNPNFEQLEDFAP